MTTALTYQWGFGTDTPVPTDYDADGKADSAIFLPSTGVWWILLSGNDRTTFAASAWGTSTDIPLP
jgi:hypothetical protein